MDFLTIASEEEAPETHRDPAYFLPKHDPAGSLVLVVFLKGESPPRGCASAEVFASLGSHVFYAFDVDQGSIVEEWARWLAEEDKPDGVYVIECRWIGYGEDAEFEPTEIRVPTVEEREVIQANGALEAVVHEWIKGWANVPCQCCGRPGCEHTEYLLKCPPREEE